MKKVLEVATVTVVVADEPKKLGRKVDVFSKYQQALKARLEKKEAHGGYLPLGREPDSNSKRQLGIAERAKLAAKGIVIKQGRPVMTEEHKAAWRAERAVAAAAAAKRLLLINH